MNDSERQELVDLVSAAKSNVDLLVRITSTPSTREYQLMEEIAAQAEAIKDAVYYMVSDIEQEDEAQSDY